jgi:protein-tyrosine phosphatase
MAAKIKDGLFIGDAETSQSEVFINDNKISNLINLSGREVPNVWASHGLVYLTYYWEDRPDYKLFSSHEDALLTDIVEFIDVSISHGISVLMFSRKGTGRCVIAACVYLMMKYHWGFEKTYDYVYSKKPDIDLNKGFIQQMFALDMKLLAARQKALAARNGIPNTFKIEANMTINDISAMLPPVEARRWNAWDPEYVLEGAEGRVNHSMDSEHKGEGGSGRYRDSKSGDAKGTDGSKKGVTLTGPGVGEDDELILINSFLNSKNTITERPGPYLDVYSIHKDFKLKFNPVCYEEDVNWFPSASAARVPTRGAMKGCRARHAAQLITAAAQPKQIQQGGSAQHAHSQAQQHSTTSGAYAADSKRTDAKSTESSTQNAASAHNTGKAPSNVSLDNIAPMYIINSQREAAEAARTSSAGNGASHAGSRDAGAAAYYTAPGEYGQEGSPPASTQSSPAHTGLAPPGSAAARQQQQGSTQRAPTQSAAQSSSQPQGPGYSSDLYEFVGIQSEQGRSRTNREGQRTWGPRDSITVQRDHSSSSIHSAASAGTTSSAAYADYKRSGSDYSDYPDPHHDEGSRQSAARRQPSPQTQQHAAATNINRAGATPAPAPAPLTAEERLRNLMADMQRHKTGAASSQSTNVSHSRDYGERDRPAPQGPSLYELATMQVVPGAGRRTGTEYDAYEHGGDYEEEDLTDPLSAFQRQSADYGYEGGGRGGSGAVRARHDVQTSSTGRHTGAGLTGSGRPGSAGPGAPRTAWAGGSRGTSPSNSRPASPGPGDPRASSGGGAGAAYGTAPGRYSSPSSGRRMPVGTGSVSSNLSVNSINSAGSAQVVGAGASSSSRVYR